MEIITITPALYGLGTEMIYLHCSIGLESIHKPISEKRTRLIHLDTLGSKRGLSRYEDIARFEKPNVILMTKNNNITTMPLSCGIAKVVTGETKRELYETLTNKLYDYVVVSWFPERTQRLREIKETMNLPTLPIIALEFGGNIKEEIVTMSRERLATIGITSAPWKYGSYGILFHPKRGLQVNSEILDIPEWEYESQLPSEYNQHLVECWSKRIIPISLIELARREKE